MISQVHPHKNFIYLILSVTCLLSSNVYPSVDMATQNLLTIFSKDDVKALRTFIQENSAYDWNNLRPSAWPQNNPVTAPLQIYEFISTNNHTYKPLPAGTTNYNYSSLPQQKTTAFIDCICYRANKCLLYLLHEQTFFSKKTLKKKSSLHFYPLDHACIGQLNIEAMHILIPFYEQNKLKLKNAMSPSSLSLYFKNKKNIEEQSEKLDVKHEQILTTHHKSSDYNLKRIISVDYKQIESFKKENPLYDWTGKRMPFTNKSGNPTSPLLYAASHYSDGAANKAALQLIHDNFYNQDYISSAEDDAIMQYFFRKAGLNYPQLYKAH